MMVHPPSLDYFNQIARPDDIGGVPLVNTPLLLRITSGKRLVMSPSVELARERAGEFVEHAEYFGYNLEHWPDTPASERNDPAAASQAAAAFARGHNLGYVIGPDLQFTEDAGADLARPADIYVIQGQRLQENLPRFQATVTAFAQAVRSGNPRVKVWVQVSSSFGTPEQTLLALQAVQDHIDGIWLHYNQTAQSFAALQELIQLLRPDTRLSAPTPTRPTRATAPPAPIETTPQQVVPSASTPASAPGPATQPAPTASPSTPLPVYLTPTPGPLTRVLGLPGFSSLIGGAMLVVAGGLVALGFALGYLWHRHRHLT